MCIENAFIALELVPYTVLWPILLFALSQFITANSNFILVHRKYFLFSSLVATPQCLPSLFEWWAIFFHIFSDLYSFCFNIISVSINVLVPSVQISLIQVFISIYPYTNFNSIAFYVQCKLKNNKNKNNIKKKKTNYLIYCILWADYVSKYKWECFYTMTINIEYKFNECKHYFFFV